MYKAASHVDSSGSHFKLSLHTRRQVMVFLSVHDIVQLVLLGEVCSHATNLWMRHSACIGQEVMWMHAWGALLDAC